MGTREKAADIDFSDFLEEDAESQLKEAGECGWLACLLADGSSIRQMADDASTSRQALAI
jgi:hypothetical protein